jgi:ATP-dependent helicase/nuclease subunit B
MPITLITGPASSAKARVVMDAVRGHLAHGQEPLLIVPTSDDADHCRRELAEGGAVMGARVELFEGLIGEAVRRAGVGRPTLGPLAREQALTAVLAEREPTPGKPTPGYTRALAAFVSELQVRRVTPNRLGRAMREWRTADGEEPPGGQVAEVFAEYQSLLARIGRDDDELRAVRALDALRRSPALWRGAPVLFWGFDDFAPLQIDAIESLGAVVDARLMVSLDYEPGRTAFAGRAGTFQTLAALASEHRSLPARAEDHAPAARAALSHLERSLFEPGVRRVDPGGSVRLLEGRDERDELELVAREIGQLLCRGMAPEEIAVALRAWGSTVGLLEEVLASARIPYAMRRSRPFGDTGIGRALIGLLRCAGSGGEVEDLLAWLRAPGVLGTSSRARAGLEQADWLERSVRRSGATSAAQARALWERRYRRLARIDRLREAADRGGRALIERATRELRWLFCAPRRGQASVLESDELDEASALAAGERALSELAELARVAPELAPGDPARLARSLEGVKLHSGERPSAGAVAVLEPNALAGSGGARRVRALFLCGLQEGVFPAPARQQPFLAEEERRRLATLAGLRLTAGEDGLAGERYLFYQAVSRPRELLVLSWHATDDEGGPGVRSLFVEDVRDLFAEPSPRFAEPSPRFAEPSPRFAEPSPRIEHRPLKLGPRSGADAPPARTWSGFSPALIGSHARTWSASSLELWISCPVRWLVERMLRAKQLEADSEPMARGGLAHVALKDTFEALRRETGSARLTVSQLGLAGELMREALNDNEREFPLSAVPERRPGARRRLEADLLRYLGHVAQSGTGSLEPRYFELAFGFEDADAGSLPALDLGGGLMLRGRIDRVDVGEDGTAVVYDYKGRNVPPPEKWIEQGHLQIALYMVAVERLLGLRAVGGFYQPLGAGDLRARGVLDRDGGVEIDCVGGDVREHAEARSLLDEAVARARTAAAQSERGEVETRPQTCAFGGGCMYPTVCRCER